MGDKKLNICMRQPSSRLLIGAKEEEEEEEILSFLLLLFIFLDFLPSCSSTSIAALDGKDNLFPGIFFLLKKEMAEEKKKKEIVFFLKILTA